MNDVTMCIKTIYRPDSLRALLASICQYHPGVAVLVADDSPEQDARDVTDVICREYGAQSLQGLDPDIGLSAGRNTLVDAAQTDLVVILDDDFVLIQPINALCEPIRHGLFDIAGGAVNHYGQQAHFEGYIRREGETIHLTRLKRPIIGPTSCDITWNFLCAKRSTFQRIRWNEKLKLCEHIPFFLDACAQKAKVVYIPDAKVDHRPPVPPASYSPYRKARATEYWNLYRRLYGVETIRGTLS